MVESDSGTKISPLDRLCSIFDCAANRFMIFVRRVTGQAAALERAAGVVDEIAGWYKDCDPGDDWFHADDVERILREISTDIRDLKVVGLP